MNSSVPYTNVIQLQRQELDLNQHNLTTSPQEGIAETKTVFPQPPIHPIEILTHQRQRHPHRQYQYHNPNQSQYNQYQYFGTEIVRLHLKNWMVKYVMYNESLCRYVSSFIIYRII